VISSAVAALSRWIVPCLAVAAVVATVPSEPMASTNIRLVDEVNPLAGRPFYVDPISKAMNASHGDPSSPQLAYVANTPQAYWLDQAFPAGSVTGVVSRLTGAAQAAGATPLLALYAIPHRDCGSYAAGGFGSGDAYRQWVDAIAAGLGCAGGDHPRTRCTGHGRLPVG
jgi:endoglucanase